MTTRRPAGRYIISTIRTETMGSRRVYVVHSLDASTPGSTCLTRAWRLVSEFRGARIEIGQPSMLDGSAWDSTPRSERAAVARYAAKLERAEDAESESVRP